ncbi:ATP-dependent RNA helicase dbp4 [Bachmanniomyces sp. S44760]|nr:ATP-dependent RNA helicase dbp4 [Bachmanniomyces sp. S44760]
MAPLQKKRRPPASSSQVRPQKRKRVEEDLGALEQTIQDLKLDDVKAVVDLPLSKQTASGLEASHFKTLTDIQRKAVPLGLKKFDILGAAKTGSGKTLAFLIPVLENLYRKKWTELDGLGALILSPTRELAIQIFEVLRKIGRYHTFSAGLVIGGKSLQEERDRLGRINILVCTPGRILQHMDQTAAFEVDNLQMLVLDEADRILDMGFQGAVDAIIEHLPNSRQTLLFSATQTKKVSDLARLSLKDPEYVSVHEAATSSTPSTLQQHYIVTPLPEKLDVLWSFIRANLKAKILVFLSSGKQVRFVYESFRHLQPGIPLLHLHGRQKQTARLGITMKFSRSSNSCLFATDVVARGLDFPAVDWVIQVDCPEDADTYIHRVGRTARYERDGRAVLFLEPSEEHGMLRRLQHKKIPIEKINVRQKKKHSIQNQLQNMCFKDPELKYLGQKAFVSYVKSVNIQKDKDVFKMNELPLEEFSTSMGLPGAPRIKFRRGEDVKAIKNAPRTALSSSEDEDDEQAQPVGETKPKETVKTKYDRMFERRNHDVLAQHYTKLIYDREDATTNELGDADEDEGFLTVKCRLSVTSDSGDEQHDEEYRKEQGAQKLHPGSKTPTVSGKKPPATVSKRWEKLLPSKKELLKLRGKGRKLVYDEDGQPHEIYEFKDEDQIEQQGSADAQRAKFLEAEKIKIQAADLQDKEKLKEKKKAKREKRKARELELEEEAVESRVVLIPFEDQEVDEGGRFDDMDSEDDSHRHVKKPKKWFEDDSGGEAAARRNRKVDVAEPESLEDLETLASGLLR